MKIGIFSELNEDVYAGVLELLKKHIDKSPEVIFPVTIETRKFANSVIRACLEMKATMTAHFESAVGLDPLIVQVDDVCVSDDPTISAIHQLGQDDVVGIVWNDSEEDHLVLHAVEDLAIEVWDISSGLTPIEIDPSFNPMDPEVLRNAMLDSFEKFVDILAAYIGTTVMESLGQAVSEHLVDQVFNKDITPFDDLD